MKKIILVVCLLGSFIVSLNAGTYGGGSGTEGSPYIIATFAHLQELQSTSGDWGSYFEQTANITTSGTWTPIGNSTTEFTGTYDGGGFTISDVYITGSSHYQGLFGYTNGSTIENVGVVNCDITGGSILGGLIGYHYDGSITNCYSTGSVSGSSGYVGGLIGYHYDSSITNCYSSCSVSESSDMATGGLIGYQDSGSVTNCYSTGSVSGNEEVGGLIGYQDSGSVTSSYWDTETSGQSTSAGGTGKTTAEMKLEATFTDWDFTNTWAFDAVYNDGYPYLQDNNTLPVTLSAFTAQLVENIPTIHWSTQSETDNMGWFIYRSNENDFSSSKVVSEMIEGHGTTTQPQNYVYEDRIPNPEVGDRYYYWLESIDYSGIINHYNRVAILTIPENSDPGNNGVIEPERFGLFQNEPNPVISSTRISFNLTETAQVDLVIYNLKGQLVKTLYSGIASKHTVVWDGKDKNGKRLENGVYYYKLVVNGKTEKTKKLILMR